MNYDLCLFCDLSYSFIMYSKVNLLIKLWISGKAGSDGKEGKKCDFHFRKRGWKDTERDSESGEKKNSEEHSL